MGPVIAMLIEQVELLGLQGRAGGGGVEAPQVRSACAASPYQNQCDVTILSEETSMWQR
jgi:hypothetical protein